MGAGDAGRGKSLVIQRSDQVDRYVLEIVAARLFDPGVCFALLVLLVVGDGKARNEGCELERVFSRFPCTLGTVRR